MIIPKDIQTVIQCYHTGESTSTIGMRYGVSAAAIAYHLKRAGIVLRKVGRPSGMKNKLKTQLENK